ncbi:hypothetical protein BJX68DRAFT_252237 [Aspergillus pseudodeflectus]|uniref:Major facilitator superfamily (MFS) profile domain-containing protein n=1 Tax=Aspergillus pseudodeflectus TaxID=176178 RepID=A0ABR4L3Y5_9EURO
MASARGEQLGIQQLCTDQPWWRVPHLVKLNILLFVSYLTSYVGGFDGSMLNGVQTVTQWQEYFDHPSGSILSLMVNMQVIAADRFGRRHPILLGSVLIIAGTLLQGCTQNMGMFLAGRFFIGLGGEFVATAAPPLLGELAYPTHRAFTAVYNTTWYVGAIVAAWSTYGTFKMPNSWSWRIPSLLQAAVSIIQIAFIYFVPESPRWLIANNQTTQATKILSEHHTGSEEPNELVRLQVAEITAAIEFERTCDSVSYLQFFQTSGANPCPPLSKGNRHRLFIVVAIGFIIQWCGNQLISSYLALVLIDTGITNPETQNLINGGLQIYNLVIACGAATLVDRLGRRFLLRFLLLTSTIGMLIAFTIWTILAARNQQTEDGDKGLAIGVMVMMFVFCAFYNLAMNPVPIAYILEVLPYTLRTKGLTAFNLAQYCSGIFNGFVNPIALEDLRWRYYIVFVCALVLWLVVIYFTFPETRSLTLEEVSQIFDGRGVLERTYDIKAEGLGQADHTEEVNAEHKA